MKFVAIWKCVSRNVLGYQSSYMGEYTQVGYATVCLVALSGKIKAIQPSVDACSDLTLVWRRKCQRWLDRLEEKVVKNEQ